MIVEQIRRIVSDLLGVPMDRVTAGSSPENIEVWDSIQQLNLVLTIEERFGFQLSPEETEQMQNIGAIAKLVERKLQSPDAG